MRTIIADDEYPALKLLEHYVKQYENLNLIRKFQNGKDLHEWLDENEADLMIIDIQMPYQTGINVVKKLRAAPMVIFTTAYDNFAVDAFEQGVVDYLLKPVSPERFKQAIQRADQLFRMRNQAPAEPEPDFIMVRAERQTIKISLKDVLYIRSMAEYVKICLHNEEVIITHDSLKHMEELLGNRNFIRVHKSYLVPLTSILSLGTQGITLVNKTEIPVGNLYKEAVRSKFTG